MAMATTAVDNVASRPRGFATVLGVEFALAGGLLLFLKADAWYIVLAILAVLGLTLTILQRRPHIEDYIAAAFTLHRKLATVLGVAIALVFPLALGSNTYALHLLIIGEIYSVLALALNFQLGSANIPNFATGASYGIGAYTSALLAVNFGISFWLLLPTAAAVATIFGFLLGVPSMRTRGSYLALITIAFGVVVQQLLNNLPWTGGPNGVVGIPAPTLFGHSFDMPIAIFGQSMPSQANFYYLMLAILALAVIVARRLHASRVGLAWNALRADELAASCQGINVVRYKILAFVVDAFLSGFAGTVYAFYVSYISPDSFTFLVSVMIMTMVIVGGMDNIFGVIVGAFLMTMLPEKFRAFSDYRILFFGVVVVLFLMLRPQGLFPQRLRRYGAPK
jgi:ABC-type branched-subunit amino acid transport system permease subunit